VVIRKVLIAGGIVGVVVLAATCRLVESDDPKDDPPVVMDTLTESYGAVTISLSTLYGSTAFLGRINDGPTPSNLVWEEVDAVGGCRLLQPRVPVCSDPCGSSAACVDDDNCQPYAKGLNVGTLTVTGLKISDGATSFTVDPIANNYQMIGMTLQYPPAAEGDLVTITAAGKDDIAKFSMSVRAIKPLKILNTEILCPDGEDINLKWEAPADPSQSFIHYLIDISYHGGTKAKIEGTCADNGAFTIPAKLLDHLKNFGISGFPKIEITRKAIGSNADMKARLVMESKVTMMLTIPGYYSCNNDNECPNGMKCGEAFLCE
jgi:hypothetical protein